MRKYRRYTMGAVVFVVMCLLPAGLFASDPMFLFLEIDGTIIEGDSHIVSLERENSIVVYSFGYEVVAPMEVGGATGRRQHGPFKIVKAVDKSSPLLYKALCEYQNVNSAELRFYRPSPSGSGAEEHYYTIRLESAYITSIRTAASADSDSFDREIVAFVFQDIIWTYMDGGVEYHDGWAGED